ncbi:hypothetical protein IXO278_16740, partial [Xanthomonas oryzae pv. oryzae]
FMSDDGPPPNIGRGRLALSTGVFMVTGRAANNTTALTAGRARPVLGIGMYHGSAAVLSAPSAPT